MDRLVLHIPETLNDGLAVSPARLAQYEDELLEIAGGFTLTHAIGAWRAASGQTYREPLRLYAVDVGADSAGERLRRLAARIARELGQVAVYVTGSPISDESVSQPEPALAAPIDGRKG